MRPKRIPVHQDLATSHLSKDFQGEGGVDLLFLQVFIGAIRFEQTLLGMIGVSHNGKTARL